MADHSEIPVHKERKPFPLWAIVVFCVTIGFSIGFLHAGPPRTAYDGAIGEEPVKSLNDPTVSVGDRVDLGPLIAANSCAANLSLRRGPWGESETGAIYLEECDWDPYLSGGILMKGRTMRLENETWYPFEGMMKDRKEAKWEFNGSFGACEYLGVGQMETRENGYIVTNFSIQCGPASPWVDGKQIQLDVVCPKQDLWVLVAADPRKSGWNGIPDCLSVNYNHSRGKVTRPMALAYSVNGTVLGALA